MPLAVTHFVIAVILITLFREHYVKKKKYFPMYYVFIGGLAGLLPDIDFLLYFFGLTYEQAHKTFTHNLVLPLVFVALAYISKPLESFRFRDARIEYKKLFLVIAAGVAIHVVLDALLSVGPVMLFFPFSDFAVGLNIVNYLQPGPLKDLFFPLIDAIMLIFWISYLEYKHKISSFF